MFQFVKNSRFEFKCLDEHGNVCNAEQRQEYINFVDNNTFDKSKLIMVTPTKALFNEKLTLFSRKDAKDFKELKDRIAELNSKRLMEENIKKRYIINNQERLRKFIIACEKSKVQLQPMDYVDHCSNMRAFTEKYYQYMPNPQKYSSDHLEQKMRTKYSFYL